MSAPTRITVVTKLGSQTLRPEFIVGQLAVHRTLYTSGRVADWSVTHVLSGRVVFRLVETVTLDELRQFAGRLKELDFDRCFRQGCVDVAVPQRAQEIADQWEWEAFPDNPFTVFLPLPRAHAKE